MRIISPLIILLSSIIFSLPSHGKDSHAAGKEYTIEMAMKGNKMVYSPAKLSIHLGDKVTFVMVSGAPHTVTFYTNKVPGKTADEKTHLAEKLSYKKNNGFFYEPGESYTIHFIDLPKGKYRYYCIPHQGMGMKGMIKVK